MARCLQCGKPHNRKKFCSNSCKDKWHNWNNPRGKFAHLKEINKQNEEDNYCHPFSSDAIGQY